MSKLKTYNVLYLLVVCLLIAVFDANAARPNTKGYPIKSEQKHHYSFQALSNDGIEVIGGLWAIAEDMRGFIWFGGENGLVRFDGYEAKLYRNDAESPNSLSSSYIHDLLVDGQGRLWVGTNYGLNLYRPETDDFAHFFNDAKDIKSMGGNGVKCLLEDSRGNIWVGHGEAGLSRYEPKLNIFERFKHNPGNPHSLAENNIYALAEDRDGSLWIGTNSHGLDRLTIDRSNLAIATKFEHFKSSHNRSDSLTGDAIRSLWVDNINQLWVGTTEGLNRFNRGEGTFTRFVNVEGDVGSISFNFVQSIAEDGEGNLWISTSGSGLNLFDRNNARFVRFTHSPNDRGSLFNNNVRVMYLDSKDNFWLGHYASGVSMLDRYASAFENFYSTPFDENSLNYNEIAAVDEDANGDLWVGTSKGLNRLSRATGKVIRYLYDQNNPSSINQGGVLGLLDDSQGRLWAGLWGGGLNRLDPGADGFVRYLKDSQSEGLFSNTVWGLFQDSTGRIWVGNHLGGLTYYDDTTDSFVRLPQNSTDPGGLSCNSVFSIFEDSYKNLWVGCSNGLYMREAGRVHFRHFYHVNSDPSSISASHIWVIQEDRDRNVWIGTQGGGVNLFDRESDSFTSYRVKHGLADDLVTGILQDDMGYLWFSTGGGLSRFDIKSGTFRNYDQRHGLPGNVFNRAAYLKTKSHELVFGSKDGLTIFNPRLLHENRIPPPVEIVDFQLFNKSVPIGSSHSPLKKSILETDQLKLTYEQSSFSFQFSALNYRVTSMNKYAYKLEGFDREWIDAGSRRWAYYTNLDPGSYKFKVKASNNEGVWNNKGRTIDIVIIPPWWLSVWAFLCYGLILIALASLVSYTFWQKKVAENERRVSDRLREIDKIKDSFLANTSHELRTPLHGMIGLAESLVNGVAGPQSEEANYYLNMIIISGKRLANLVNDILDFSKLRESKVSLRKVSVDLRSVTEVVVALFQPMLNDRSIMLKNNVDRDLTCVLADENRLQQILYNLIGNAVKFTDDDGLIEIVAEESNSLVKISVTDNGIGIAEDKQGTIFGSFQQVDGVDTHGATGTGLGLAVTQQLVELHGGTIELRSTLGKGSTFVFTLPKAKPGLKPLVNVDSPAGSAKRSRIVDGYVFAKKSAASNPGEGDGQQASDFPFHILIVDDEPVNRLVLDGFLKIKNYRITECCSGSDALDVLSRENDISLVLLDVMMPKMTGFETCKKIRERYTARELPVIFLTGKNLREDLEAGFIAGGNDFLTKPVSREELLLRVGTHLKLSDNAGLNNS